MANEALMSYRTAWTVGEDVLRGGWTTDKQLVLEMEMLRERFNDARTGALRTVTQAPPSISPSIINTDSERKHYDALVTAGLSTQANMLLEKINLRMISDAGYDEIDFAGMAHVLKFKPYPDHQRWQQFDRNGLGRFAGKWCKRGPEAILAPITALKDPMPLGVVEAYSKAKDSGFFTDFRVCGPKTIFSELPKQTIDPILLGVRTIANVTRYFLIAKW